MIWAPYNLVSAHVCSTASKPLLVTLWTMASIRRFASSEESSKVRPCVTEGGFRNGVLKVTRSLYGQVGAGNLCCFTVPDSPEDSRNKYFHCIWASRFLTWSFYVHLPNLTNGIILSIFNSTELLKPTFYWKMQIQELHK